MMLSLSSFMNKCLSPPPAVKIMSSVYSLQHATQSTIIAVIINIII